jgi:hypothetical protein
VPVGDFQKPWGPGNVHQVMDAVSRSGRLTSLKTLSSLLGFGFGFGFDL